MVNRQYEQFNCYVVLEVQSNSSPSEIKAAHRRASLKFHPDRGGSHDQQVKINVAYEILSDPVERQAHDIYWKISIKKGSSHTSSENPNYRNSSSSSSNQSRQRPFANFEARLRSSIQQKKAETWSELDSLNNSIFKKYTEQHSKSKNSFLIACVAALGSVALANARMPIFWVGFGISSLWAISKLRGVTFDGLHVPLFGSGANEILRNHARLVAGKRCKEKADSFDKYLSNFASIVELVSRDSSFDDSEEHVARRLVAALFLSGYKPLSYDNENRSILLADGEERLLVRFRHRTGVAVNVTYVQKLVQLMKMYRVTTGLLFCSPGLSGNAASLARRENIRGYSLESMNTWIDQILNSDRSGPAGDVLGNLDELKNFLSGISPRFNRWNNRRRRY